MLYDIILFLHIIGAIVMFIAVGITLTAMVSMIHSKKVSTMQTWAALAVKLDGLLPLSVILILLPGLYLVITSWGWGHAWVNVSLFILLLMTVMGPAINLRRLKDILSAVNTEAANTEVPSAILVEKAKDRTLWNSVSIMTMLAFGLVFLMTVKVGLIGSVFVVMASILAGFAAARFLLRRPGGTVSSESTETIS